MSFETSLKAHLDAALSDDVGGRIYPLTLPQSPVYPAITYRRTGDERHTFVTGEQNSYVVADVQIDCWTGPGSSSYMQCKALAEKLRTSLVNVRGNLSGWHVYGSHIVGYVELYESAVDAVRCSHIFEISFDEDQ